LNVALVKHLNYVHNIDVVSISRWLYCGVR